MGKQAKGMKREILRGGLDDNGPLLKVKSISLKLASHEMKKEVMPEKWMEVKLRGRTKKRHVIGEIAMILAFLVGKNLPIVWE